MSTGQLAGKAAELYIFSELLRHEVIPYLPLVDAGASPLLKTAKGDLLESTLLLPGEANEKAKGTFTIPDYQPDKKRFILCAEFDESDAPIVWVFPSLVFHAYSSGPDRRGLRKLNLDGGHKKYFGKPLRDYIRGFRERWELIANYRYYRRFMNSPERYDDLEDILLMQLVIEEPETDGEPVPFKASAFGVTDALSG